MEYNITRWLQDELNLANFCESDLCQFVDGPRNCRLFRKFIDFLAESTLCERKFPDVYANEELLEANGEFDSQTKNLAKIKHDLLSYTKESEKLELKLLALRENIINVKDLHESLEVRIRELVSYAEKLYSKLESATNQISGNDIHDLYLALSDDLENSFNLVIDLEKLAKDATTDLNGHTDKDLKNLFDGINEIHDMISKTGSSIEAKIKSLEAHYEPNKININDIEGLKIPEFVDEIVEMDIKERKEEKFIKEFNERSKILEKQIEPVELEDKTRRTELEREYEDFVHLHFSRVRIDSSAEHESCVD